MFSKSSTTILVSLFATIQATPVNFKNCDHLKIEQLNEHASECGNNEFTAECLSKFNAKGLSRSCLEKFKFPQDMTSKTVKELSEGEATQLPLEPAFMRAFLNKHGDWDHSHAVDIAKYLASNEEFMGKILGDATFPRSLIAKFIMADSAPVLKPSTCAKFNADLARDLAPDSFKNIEGDCFAALPKEFISAASSKLIGGINPKAFRSITVDQAQVLEAKQVTEMTKEQVENWGVDPSVPVVDPNAAPPIMEEQRKAAEEYRKKHPCFYVKRWLSNLPAAVKAAMEARCSPFLNAATIIGISSMTLMLAVMVALVFLI